MKSPQYKVMEKFIKCYQPRFMLVNENDEYVWCHGKDCAKCEMLVECSILDKMCVSKEEYDHFKLEYPEFFI